MILSIIFLFNFSLVEIWEEFQIQFGAKLLEN
jgi:hypothetical protein